MVIKLDHVYYRWPLPIYRSTVDRLSVDYQLTIGQQSTDISVAYRLIVDHKLTYSQLIVVLTDTVLDHRYSTDG